MEACEKKKPKTTQNQKNYRPQIETKNEKETQKA